MKKIIFLDTDTFDSTLHLGSHNYAKLFKERGWEVLWLSQPINPISFLNKKNKRQHITGFHNGLQKSEANIFYYTPFTFLPYINILFLENLWFAKNSLLYSFPSLKKILYQTGFSKVDVLFINNIKLISIIKLLKVEGSIVTRIPDDFSAFSHNPSNILQLEEFVLKMSDVVLCVTNSLLRKAKSINNNSYLLTNGVDFKKFVGLHDKPIELTKIPGKKVIYVGAISNWFDFEPLAYAAENMKDISFIIIGPILDKNINFFEKNNFSNIYYLGPRRHELIPDYISNCDCGIIPFKVNKLTYGGCFIKMFEYFASGIPVVSSSLSLPFPNAVYTYNDKMEFVQSIRTALNESKDKKETRLSIARENSWQARFEKIISLIN